jgi:hypothetical protein
MCFTSAFPDLLHVTIVLVLADELRCPLALLTMRFTGRCPDLPKLLSSIPALYFFFLSSSSVSFRLLFFVPDYVQKHWLT